jgi:hypothetical protein
MSVDQTCPVCASEGRVTLAPLGENHLWNIECPRCCRYEVVGTDILALRNAFSNDRQKANASGWLRENHGARLSREAIDRLKVLPTPTVLERARKLLRSYAHRYPNPGIGIRASILELEEVARAWAVDGDELHYIIKRFLIDEVKWLVDLDNGSVSGGTYHVAISPAGWAHLEHSVARPGPSPAIFVAMWFHNDVSEARKRIETAITSAGYDAVFIDSKRHENLIDNEIIASIRESRLIIADFTGRRGGVYFEAGFAMGFGLPVVRTCNLADKSELHFDINHYNILFWKPTDLEEFERDLRNRIIAAAGVGPRGLKGA